MDKCHALSRMSGLVCSLMRPLFFLSLPPFCFCFVTLFVSQTQALSHPDEVWGVSPSPTDPSLLVTCSNGARAGQADGGAGFKVPFFAIPPSDLEHCRPAADKTIEYRKCTYDRWLGRALFAGAA